jgi:hypothetical protein
MKFYAERKNFALLFTLNILATLSQKHVNIANNITSCFPLDILSVRGTKRHYWLTLSHPFAKKKKT